MNRFPPPDNDRDKLRGNDEANNNFNEKTYLIAQINRKTKVCGSQTFLFLLDCKPQTSGKKDLNKQALNACHHHKSRQLSSSQKFLESNGKNYQGSFQ
ncbi:hypothetical protein [Marivirga lumbricoides]|uniref:hypothetical protein n=1 Tax=Marivirga lumbricoides TaxID=1046115 RepID=UPI001E5D5381